ncbi:MAG TPA: hypothetical protein VH703_06820 [Solirubrobacterales bacterium]
MERVVVRTNEVGIYLACLWVFPAGFEFDVFVVAKEEPDELDPFSFGHQYEAEESGDIPAAQLRLGFLFGDGTKATNTGERFDWEGDFESPPKAPVMSGARGSGGGGNWSQSFWVWPIPPAGPLTFLCEWPQARIPLTRLEMEAEPIIEAASRAQQIFAAD